jgi:uncharacterized protein YdaU (DUF1376 family)
MANEFDFFPLFYRRLLIDTSGMRAEQFGAYVLLLLAAWDETPVGTLPDDDLILAHFARVESVDWLAMKPIVMARFQPALKGRWSQKRMRIVYDDLKARQRVKKEESDQKRANAKSGWKKRKHAPALHPQSGRVAVAMEKENETKKNDDVTDPAAAVFLDAEGFPADDPIRRHPFCSAAQVQVAQKNADYKLSVGQLQDRRGYIVAAVTGRWALMDGAGRREMQQEKAEASKRSAERKRVDAESEKEKAQQELQMMNEAISKLSEGALADHKAAVLASNPGLTAFFADADARRSPVLQAKIYERIRMAR